MTSRGVISSMNNRKGGKVQALKEVAGKDMTDHRVTKSGFK